MNSGAPGGIAFEDVSVRYGDRWAVHGVSFSVRPGEVVALAGPNGSGKSSLLLSAAGIIPVAGGTVRILDRRPSAELSAGDRALRLAWMPQEEPPGDNVPLADFVGYGRYARISRWSGPSATDRAAIIAALSQVDLDQAAERGVRELSGGERQRARLARTFAQDTPVVLLDEPTAHLDIGHQLDVLERVRRITRDSARAVVVALHDLNLAARFADRVAVLSHGRLVADGSPSEVLSAELLERVWGVVAEVRRDATTGLPYLLPRLPPATAVPAANLSRPQRIHVVAGGGSGVALVRRLLDEGYDVSLGVLPLFDTDAALAQELQLPMAAEIPFAPISAEALERFDRLVDEAEAVVVAPFPVGPANLPNLERLTSWVARKPIAVVDHPAGVRWDYTGGAAEEARRRLLGDGAVLVQDLEEVVGWLTRRFASGRAASADANELDHRVA
jgi:cobalamin transport system ATP-binding protein